MANAHKYGFSWEIKEGAQAEAWHIRYFTGDKIPQAVLDYETAKAQPQS
jgi:LAS superfamily LD-carboxypeptidase LdcB